MPADSSFESQAVENPSGSGRGTARSIARIGAIFAMDGSLDGETYVSRRMIDEATTEQAYGPCPYLGVMKLGLGLGLDSPEFPAASATCFHWGGFGGSAIMMDRRTGVSIGYALGRLVLYYRNNIREWINDHFGRQIFDASIYGLNEIPAELRTLDEVMICGLAFILCTLAAVPPAWMVGRMEPARALRNDR